MTDEEIGFKSLRTVYLFVGILAAYGIGAAARGDHYFSIMIGGVVAAIIAVAASWTLRDQWWLTNWWDL